MEALRKTATKALLFLAMLVALNLIYTYTQYEEEVLGEFPQWPEIESARDADIVYLGESSNVTYSDFDASKEPIHAFLQAHFPTLKVVGITQAAAHAGHFLTMLRNIPASSKVKAVVVTLNLRSFNAQWTHSKHEASLAKKLVLLGQGPPLWRKFLLSFKQYSTVSEAEQEKAFKAQWQKDTLHFPFASPVRNVIEWDSMLAARIWKVPEKQRSQAILATHYVKAFAFEIDTLAHPRLADLDGIVKLAASRGWKLYFNLLPENTEMATQLLGDTLTSMIRRNAAFLVRRYHQAPAKLVNHLEILPNAHFVDQSWTTEHYDEFGRRRVAAALALAMKDQFPAAYKEVKQAPNAGLALFNDCEGKVQWSQLHTCVEGKAKSGKRASMIGVKEKFSTTFATKLEKMDSTQLDSLEVDFWLYQERLDHYTGLALEASGDSVGYLWDTVGLRRMSPTLGAWVHVRHVLPCFPSLPQADVLKVYFYNPSEFPVWVDDIRLRFFGKE